MTEKEIIKDALLNGLYDEQFHGNCLLTPSLIGNHQETIWDTVRHELATCKSFTWTVAFLSLDMLTPLKVIMADLAAQGVNGTLITSNYLNFNSPRVFSELLKIPNLQVLITPANGFHAKGYFFNHGNYTTALVGSANFTRTALLSNYETMIKISSTQNGSFLRQLKGELRQLKKASQPLTTTWIQEYELNWQAPQRQQSLSFTEKQVVPNQMQTTALKEIDQLVKRGKNKGLVISATGTGKTYLGAFAVKHYQPRKFLYVVHREQIARKSMESFRRVIGGSVGDFGLLSGSRHDFSARYLFATIQTLSQEKILSQLAPETFDYILIDEAHRTAAPSYRRVLDHFQPDFWLGMTATPNRMDNQDVYRLFDYQVAYEIRLRDALNAQMLAPFHYVGVQDYEADGQIIDETTNLSRLVASDRVHYVLKQLDYYGYCGQKACGLVFCSRQAEAKELARQFTSAGHPARALTNQDNNFQRQRAVTQLEKGELEYLITVDLFNEGVDIPSLNQIVMLRNTQSSIVFTQQLGRGLRKYPGKDFVTVIDFIGNYKHNYLIPIALNNDTSRSKERARQEVRLPQNIGVSTINFSQVASERILASLEKVKLDSMVELRRAYKKLRNQLGRVPLLQDFQRFGTVSPLVFADNKLLGNYGDFLVRMGEKITLTKYENQVLSFITKELMNGKRAHELLILSQLHHESLSQEQLENYLKHKGCYVSSQLWKSLMSILSLDFFAVKSGKQMKKQQYGDESLVEFVHEKFRLNGRIRAALEKDTSFALLFDDVLQTGLVLSANYKQDQQFTLYRQYDRKDVCRLLNWPLDVSAPMYGYRVAEDECPIFITYQKQSTEMRNALYNNQLQDGQSLRWYTRSPRHLNSKEVQTLLAGVKEGRPKVKLHLFVKRNDTDGKQFYYLGTARIDPSSVKEEVLGEKKKAAVGMNLLLDHPLATEIKDTLFE